MDVTERKQLDLSVSERNFSRQLYTGETWETVFIFQSGLYTIQKTVQVRHHDHIIQTVEKILNQVRKQMLNPSFVEVACKNRKKSLQNWKAVIASATLSGHT